MYSDTKTELRTIKLSGFLGKKFGRAHRLAVDSPAEAIRALSVNINGFREFLENSHKNGVAYRFLVGNEALERSELKESLHMKHGASTTFELVPVINGAKSSLGQILFGAALMAFAWWAMPEIGFLAVGAKGAIFAPAVFSMGMSLALGGVAQLLAPKVKAESKEAVENKPSYIFNGAVNTVAQGNPVPILYGRMRVGSQVVSAGITSNDIPL